MSVFEAAFESALARTSSGVPGPGERRGSHTVLEETFKTVDKFEFDSTRLVIAASVVGEQYRTLKANLSRLRETEGAGTFTFSSSVKGEGKTTVVMNIARAFGRESGLKVAVVDCDFKRPGIGEFCRAEPRAGFEEVVGGTAEPADCGIYSRRDNITVFPIRHRPDDNHDLVAAPRFDKVVAKLRVDVRRHPVRYEPRAVDHRAAGGGDEDLRASCLS